MQRPGSPLKVRCRIFLKDHLLTEEISMYGLIKFIFRGTLAIAVLVCGMFGFRGSGGLPEVIAFKSGKTDMVLAAAPLSSTRIVPENCALASLYAPPPYRKVTFLNVQLVQSRPSKSWASSSNEKSSIIGVRSKE